MSRPDEYAFPVEHGPDTGYAPGLTKLEYACIELRIPESGNEWLDDLIAKAERRDLAAKAMQGLLALPQCFENQSISNAPGTSAELAKDLIAELKKEQA